MRRGVTVCSYIKLNRFIGTLVLGLASSGLYSGVRAAYDKTVTWSDISTLDLRPALNSEYGSDHNLFEPVLSPAALDLTLRDADSRIDPIFKIPEDMRTVVGFWLRIYTEYTTRHVVIFDDRHPEIIYDVLDFRALARSSRNQMAYEIVSRQRVREALSGYRSALKTLAVNPRPRRPTSYQRRVQHALAGFRHSRMHDFKELAKNVRAQTGQRDNIAKGLLAAETYLPKMEKIFSGMGLPVELTRLSLVESSFNLKAVSRVGATGVWQFMLKSALEYLVVDAHLGVDERLSPLKSTVAAAKLLRRNHRVFGAWHLAITSYNHGLKGLLRLPRAQRSVDEMGVLFEPCRQPGGTSYLGWAGRNYYAGFLAVLHAESYRHLFYGEPPVPALKPVAFHRLAKACSALDFAQDTGIPLHQFRLLNPDIRELRKVLPRGFWLAVPAENDRLVSLEQPDSSV